MKFFACLLLICIFSSCEKAITITTENQAPVLVVDGTIENNEAPIIFLSTSLNYFSNLSPEILTSSIVSGARVTVSDGSTTSLLKEYILPLGGAYKLIYYSTDTTNPAEIKGREGKSYQLKIEYNNVTYTSSTSIPVVAKKVDSLWWKPAPFVSDTSTRAVVMAKVTDPLGYGNYIRYFTRVNNDPFLPGAFSVFDDQVIDGTTYSIQVEQGINRNLPIDQEEYGFFKKGDSVTVKFANIDKTTYNFWRTLEFNYQSIGNPFSSPTKVLGNVSNGALGVFCGYGIQYKSLIIPK